MRLSAADSAALRERIDRSCGAGTSVVRRYRDAVRFDGRPGRDLAIRRALVEGSLREGVRIVPLPAYRGVTIHLLDETSGMETGSLKSIDGCLAAARCRADGIGRAAFESGGNTGSALTRYGRQAGVETFFFCPCENVDLLDSRLFDGPASHLIGVEDRRRVKDLAALFAKRAGIPQLPDKSCRFAAGMFRGLFILEQMLAGGAFDWIAQTISAAFGPIGIYRVLKAFPRDIPALPRFLGIQQEANCPMFRAWNPEAASRVAPPARERNALLARIMYDESPETHRTFEALRRLLLLTRGDLLTVNEEEFLSRLRASADYDPLLELLRSRGIAIGVRSGRVIDKTGMLALAGTLKAVDAGAIRPGESVLCCLTGGTGDPDGRARPEAVVRDAPDVLRYAKTIPEGR